MQAISVAEIVIDTNVLHVASERHDGVSPECVAACVVRLQRAKNRDVIVIDDGYRILQEYQAKLDPWRGKGVGEAFLKWLMQKQGDTSRVHRVPLTEHAPSQFSEFPDAALESVFDPPDRKFVAVANAHPAKPVILQAADSKWLGWWQALQAAGVRVEFLCPEDVRRFYRSKFPGEPVPPLP